MAIGVALLLFFILLSLGETTTTAARVKIVVSMAGIAALAAGAVFYLLARSRLP
jgi:lipopolysaccharide export LptBFGC system permease protein LptF